jgi:uncharacterized membrane protein (DUF485 family)
MFPTKIQAPLFAALLFIVISSGRTYKLTNDFLTMPILKKKTVSAGVPTALGIVLHAIVFFALSYVFLANK